MRSDRRIEIRKWLLERRYTQAQISREVGASECSVSLTIKGARRDKRVLEWLRRHGCPEHFLSPMPQAERAA